MNEKHIRLAKGYRNRQSDKVFDNTIIKAFFQGDQYSRGKLSTVFPDHEKAFKIIFHEQDLSIDRLKANREAKNGTK